MGADESQDGTHLAGLELDELIEQLQSRVDAMRATRDRIHQLLEAVLTLGRGLELPEVLRRIVEAGVALVDARHGVLGLIGEDGTPTRVVTIGMDEERARDGLLGELAQHPGTTGGTARYGAAGGSHLDVSITVRDQLFGQLCLAGKRGGGEFEAEDETLLSTLAVAAGIAVENARLYDETRTRQRWLEAGASITRSLLSGGEGDQVLELIVDRARGILDADLGALAFPVASDELGVDMAIGKDADVHYGLRLPLTGTFMGLAYRSEEPVSSPDIRHDPRVTAGPPRWAGLGPAVAAPLRTGSGVRGVLLLARAADEPVFTVAEIAPLTGFAGQAALAMELADHRRDGERYALFEERDRIARDLHDLAIQRLFATGMTLQSAQRLGPPPQVDDRLDRAVADLDETIKIIRSTIFGLRTHETEPASGLRARTLREVRNAERVLGLTPVLRMEGLVDTDIPGHVADDVIAVLAEALSNVARHARASSVGVALTTRPGTCSLTVTDDGIGMPSGGRRSGLTNLARRAEQHGGGFSVDTSPGGGTCLVWQVPFG